ASQYLPDVYWRGGRPPEHRERIFAQVALATLVSDLLTSLGVRPTAAVGHSLGESAALFALRAWRDRDEMLRRMQTSPLFVSDLVGRRDAARRFWGLGPDEEADWVAGGVPCGDVALPAGASRLALHGPDECVISGRRGAVEAVVGRLGRPFVPLADTATVHCEIARLVADAYRDLHRLPTTPPPGVR